MTNDAIIAGWSLLVGAHDRVMNELGAELKRDFALTIPQYDVLMRLVRTPDHRLKMAELAATLLYSSGAATKVVDRLVDRRQVRRVPDDADRRIVWVELTESGLDLIKRARRAHHASVEREVGPFASDSEARHVFAYLDRIRTGRRTP